MMPTWAIGIRTEYGTTLIELLVVLGVLALLSMTGGVVIGTLEAKRLDRECAAAYKWLRSARRHAMLTGTVSLIIANGVQLEASPRIPPLRLKRAEGIAMVAGDSGMAPGRLCFFPDGSGCPGYVELSKGDMKRRITINRFGEIDAQ